MSEILSRELWESIRDEGWAHYPAEKGSNYKTSINLRSLHESEIDATIEALAEALKTVKVRGPWWARFYDAVNAFTWNPDCVKETDEQKHALFVDLKDGGWL